MTTTDSDDTALPVSSMRVSFVKFILSVISDFILYTYKTCQE